MKTDITRQLSASVYLNPQFCNTIINFAKNPFNANVESAGIDESILLKHALNAKNKAKTFYLLLFIPSIFLLFGFFTGKVFIFFLMAIVILGATIIKDLNSKNFIKQHFLKDNFTSDFSYDGPQGELLDVLKKKTTKNVTYYSGYSPFVGAGVNVGGWSFVINIDKGKSHLGSTTTPQPFLEHELYERISQELVDLKLKNCSIADRVYFNGKKLRGNKDLLPDIFSHPVVTIPSEIFAKTMNSSIEDARFYKTIQVLAWEGDLIVSAFLRIQKNEKTLFIENNYYVLPPIKEEYRAIDRLKEYSGIGYYIRWTLGIVALAFVQFVASIAFVSVFVTEIINDIFGITLESKLRKTIKSTPDYDYGSSTSIRQLVSQTNYQQHFQKLDQEMAVKTIEKRIFNIVADFLDSKDINTDEFRERETSILNNGIIVSGGSFTSGNTSTGIGAAINNIVTSKTKKN